MKKEFGKKINCRSKRKWTKQEETYLVENWGTISVKTIAKKLERSENAVVVKKCRLGLGAFLDNGCYVTWNQLLKAIGFGHSDGYKMTSWVRNRGFPLHTKKVNNTAFKVVSLDEWWSWAEKNRDILDFSRFEENTLGFEPSWVKGKRKHDMIRRQKYTNTPWTKAEDYKLKMLLSKQIYTYHELSKKMRRTTGAIQRRVCDLKIMDRPVKADNHVCWTNDEFTKLGDLIKLGYGYELIAEEIGKSSKACRGRVYAMYLTENLDKVRKIMGAGNFGDNRPERKVKQMSVMNPKEKGEIKDSLTCLVEILSWRSKERKT